VLPVYAFLVSWYCRADIMHPVRLAPAAGALPRFNRAAASFADSARSMSKVIFPARLITLGGIGVRE
jgi:hypothetical protein